MPTQNSLDIGVVPGGSATYSFPAASDTLVGRTSTDVLQNKDLSHSSNILPTGVLFARVQSTNATTTGQTLVDITGLTVPLAVGTYEFEANLSVASSSAAGNQYGVAFSGTATIEAQIMGSLAAATAQAKRINAFNTATVAFNTVAADGAIWIGGIVTVTVAGNLLIRHFKTTSGTATVYINSYLKAEKR